MFVFQATLRQPAVLAPPPLPPRKKISSISANGSIGAIEDNNNSSDTGSVGSQTLLAEGMNILSEPATIRSVGSDVSMGTRREAKEDDEVPETDLNNEYVSSCLFLDIPQTWAVSIVQQLGLGIRIRLSKACIGRRL